MIAATGIRTNDYWEVHRRAEQWPELDCPEPGCAARLRPHGSYRRNVYEDLREIRRVRCPRCGMTHAVLPEDLCAYQRGTLDELERVMAAPGPTAGARELDAPGPEAVRRARRMRGGVRRLWGQAVSALLPATPGSVLDRVRAVVGSAPGALVRLRRWLMARFAVFFGGPCGLYRRGRPCLLIRQVATDLGSGS